MNKRVELEKRENQGALLLFVDGVRAGEIEFLFEKPNRMVISHTGVFREFEGLGLGRYLVDEAVKYAQQEQLVLSAICPFAAKVLSGK
ncbi:MAG: GNAT family N-acetyltransferase [Bacteroidales bacterium]|uniref:GNAT family N-acetyltransferase n=1 Tax=Porphyromonas sp. TaxID=1924944 RepID=UPI002979B0E6|nr:GNAT family N-acetyltransferase [Porphyromonas sp.]MDD7438477.1 GNAT family N-acetyltransferase [Bacteroidales bacterium]MDY3066643.1 GNAT family N-acetyltransferase [Porphyromonas sp.]